jgi:hypothetical protein
MASNYYGAGNTAAETVSAGTWENVTLNEWGDSVTFGDDITMTELKRFAAVMFSRAVRAESAVDNFNDAATRSAESRKSMARLFGESAKAAALDQEWCGEYEVWTTKISLALRNAGFYAEAKVYADAAERRDAFTMVVTVLARNEYAAADAQYAIADRLSDPANNYGCAYVTTTDVQRVVTESENNDAGDSSDDN